MTRTLLLLALAGACPAPAETLHYRVDWRFWHAGDIRLQYSPPGRREPGHAEVSLKTRGFVDSLFHVENHYTVSFDQEFCAVAYDFQVKEGRKHRHITAEYQHPPGKARYTDRDLAAGTIAFRQTISVPPCVHDELAALARLRSLALEPGQRLRLPVSNGKKFAGARIEVLDRQTIHTPAGEFRAIRCEAFLFNNVLYRRPGRLLLWLTDDERHLPVQFQLRLRFYYGTITLRLVNEDSP